MKVSANLSALKTTRWYEYAVRFVLGGCVTAGAGLIAKHYGPVFGGLFLAFPAIFPASATLVEKHQRQKKRRAGIVDTKRGQEAAGLDAAGATLGSLGLTAFALVVWRLLPGWNVWAVFAMAIAGWLGVSVGLWLIRKKHIAQS